MPLWFPQPGDTLLIRGEIYAFCGRSGSPSEIYVSIGGRGRVYQLRKQNNGHLYALKTFMARHRIPATVEIADICHPFQKLPGMLICDRVVLNPDEDSALLQNGEELKFAVLMPWVSGSSWWDMVSTKTPLNTQESLELAKNVAYVLSSLENEGLAHCDIGNTNVLFDRRDWSVTLIDVEEMYAPNLKRPNTEFGSPGYKHVYNPSGLWGVNADRFAGGILLSEILTWHDRIVRQVASGESYFAESELQDLNSPRYQTLLKSLKNRSPEVESYFVRLWKSKRVSGCPSLTDWYQAILAIEGKNEPPLRSSPSGTRIAWEPVDVTSKRRQRRTSSSSLQSTSLKMIGKAYDWVKTLVLTPPYRQPVINIGFLILLVLIIIVMASQGGVPVDTVIQPTSYTSAQVEAAARQTIEALTPNSPP